MAAENKNIAEQAEILASELFGEFFWNKLGPSNHDWPCEEPARHEVKTHPCDVVYYYDEPYAARQAACRNHHAVECRCCKLDLGRSPR